MIIRNYKVFWWGVCEEKYKENSYYKTYMNFKLGNFQTIELGEKPWLNPLL
jgi:hypothetical protein